MIKLFVSLLPIIILAVLIVSILAIVTKLKDSNNKSIEKLPYKKKQYLLTKAENNFYQVLKLAVKNEDIYICPKVRLADIISVGKTENRQRYFNKIQSKHIDFVLCKDNYFNPLMAIELDDNSHNRSNRVQRDEFVDSALKSAELPILRVKAGYSYKPNEIKDKVNEILNVEKNHS